MIAAANGGAAHAIRIKVKIIPIFAGGGLVALVDSKIDFPGGLVLSLADIGALVFWVATKSSFTIVHNVSDSSSFAMCRTYYLQRLDLQFVFFTIAGRPVTMTG